MESAASHGGDKVAQGQCVEGAKQKPGTGLWGAFLLKLR